MLKFRQRQPFVAAPFPPRPYLSVKFFHTLLACSAPLLLADAASAQCLDQNAPTINACMAGGGQVDLAQSFKQGAGEINGAGGFLYAGIGTPEVLSIELWSAGLEPTIRSKRQTKAFE